MERQFEELNGRIEIQTPPGEFRSIPFSWVGAAEGRVFFVAPGALLVQSIPEANVLAIVSEERRAA